MKKVVLLFLIGVVSGCAVKLPPLTNIDKSQITKIGILNYASDHPQHVHVGTTIFNNFSKELDFDWKVKQTFNDVLSDCIKERYNFQVALLDETNIDLEEFSKISTYSSDTWAFQEKYESIRNKLRSEDYDAIVVFYEFEFGVPSYDGHPAAGYGLYTRSFLKIVNYYSYNHLIPVVYYLNQPGWKGGLADENIPFSNNIRSLRIKNLESVTEPELEKAKENVLDYVRTAANKMCGKILPTS